MSGVMLKVALYGLIRFCFDLLGDVHWQWGVVLLILVLYQRWAAFCMP